MERRERTRQQFARINVESQMLLGCALKSQARKLKFNEMAGYSGTPLAKKLGIKPEQTVVTIGAPGNYKKLLSPVPERVVFTPAIEKGASFVHLFVSERKALERELKRLRKLIADAGVLWVSWPKKSSGVKTDITEDVIREVCLPLGFVDVKVCAVDETWSGLKLMIRRENRREQVPG
jgi:hypothetical protein